MNASNSPFFSLILFILILVCTLCTVNLYLGFKRNKKDSFGRLVNAFIVFLFINALYVGIVECFFTGQAWMNRMFPFVFLYGPFYYFALRALRQPDLSWKISLIHVIPFLGFLLAFIVYLFNGWYNDLIKYEYFMRFKIWLSLVSLAGYCFYGFYNKVRYVEKLDDKRTIMLFMTVMLLFVSMLHFSVFAYRSFVVRTEQSVYLFRAIICCCMLVITIVVFLYQTAPLLNQSTTDNLVMVSGTLGFKESMPRYEKSVLSESQLDTYEAILNETMKVKELFLNQELSLNELALMVKIPSHHLTQLLNTKLQVTFHNYVNHLRVLHVCRMMETPRGRKLTLEELGGGSGFNSKASFNRHFKLWMGCTPSEYRKRLI